MTLMNCCSSPQISDDPDRLIAAAARISDNPDRLIAAAALRFLTTLVDWLLQQPSNF